MISPYELIDCVQRMTPDHKKEFIKLLFDDASKREFLNELLAQPLVQVDLLDPRTEASIRRIFDEDRGLLKHFHCIVESK